MCLTFNIHNPSNGKISEQIDVGCQLDGIHRGLLLDIHDEIDGEHTVVATQRLDDLIFRAIQIAFQLRIQSIQNSKQIEIQTELRLNGE